MSRPSARQRREPPKLRLVPEPGVAAHDFGAGPPPDSDALSSSTAAGSLTGAEPSGGEAPEQARSAHIALQAGTVINPLTVVPVLDLGVLDDVDRVTHAVNEGQLVLGQAALRPLDPDQVERVARWLNGAYRQGRDALDRLREEVQITAPEAVGRCGPTPLPPAPRRGDGDVPCAG
jgi:hypothetical protein